VTGVLPKPRSDKGKRRKVEPEKVLEAIEQVLPLFRGKSYSKAQIYRACIEKGLLRRERIAPNTFSRMVSELEMLKPHSQATNKKRLAFSKQFANQMWQADTMYGPHVKDAKGQPRRTFLVGFLDDASRVVVHGEFFFNDSAESLMRALRSALYKRGIPEQIYVDNGSAYTSKEIVSVCARLGILLSHAPVRDGAAKGKIERFFRSVRERFLSRRLDLSSLEKLNRQFCAWVEERYNARAHSTLGMKPIDRFGLDIARIRFLPPNEDNDELFFAEENRTVKKDNTFSLRNVRFEAPRDLRGRKIQARFDRARFDRIVVYYNNEHMGQAQILDPVANDRKPNAAKGELR
jgi:transposase InsO family protein